MANKIKRSTFLKGMAGASLAAVSGKFIYDTFLKRPDIPCRILGPSMNIGHLIRDGAIKGTEGALTVKTQVAIVGGGMSGLSAGWWLQKNGFTDFKILELENHPGGNSASGENSISEYPWGAHYVPLANEESVYVREIFKEFGIIESFNKDGLPQYNELYLCHDPEERLFKDGSFQEGLVPKRGLRENDKKEIERFFETIVEYRNKIGTDGKPAFAIPLELSSCDQEFVDLDSISMAEWLTKYNFKSIPLIWYINYCCRDDYGAGIEEVSAWAGIHYFSGRRGRAQNADQNSVVTWPEGNGFLVKKLKEKLGSFIQTNACVFDINQEDEKFNTVYIDTKTKKNVVVQSDFVIFSAPRFLSKYVIKTITDTAYIDELKYPPWMVANITLKKLPEARGISSAWDNVCYRSASLGYVVATHQKITTQEISPTVVTYYYPLSEEDPAIARKKLVRADTKNWKEIIIKDLKKMHPLIEDDMVSIDLWPWGHGMISPGIGYIWGPTRKKMIENHGNILFAHTDMSGISNFEESQYRGVEAAKQILKSIKTT